MKFILKLFVCAIFAMVFPVAFVSADIATVGAVHDYVKQKWEIDIPYRVGTESHIVNMTYLMQVVDRANKELNGGATTDYASDENYTVGLASTVVVRDAIDTMVEKEACPPNTFCFVPASSGTEFGFYLDAAGEFTIDWGDGSVENMSFDRANNYMLVERSDHGENKGRLISHTYADSANLYTIRLRGHATAYAYKGNMSMTNPDIGFMAGSKGISSMAGCLGCVFSTLSNGTQPCFHSTFEDNTELTGEIPQNLFAGINGGTSLYMFGFTFAGCSGLTGTIPAGLFAGVSGEPVWNMFMSTFSGCSGLTGIGDGLFGDISGDLDDGMFYGTFSGCTSLTGPSATVGTGANKQYLYQRWTRATSNQVGACYSGATGLDDYFYIPIGWGGQNPEVWRDDDDIIVD